MTIQQIGSGAGARGGRRSARNAAVALAAVTSVDEFVGTFVSANNANGTVNIDFGKGSVVCFNAGVFQPLPGNSVRCIKVGAATIMLGLAAPKSSIGTVSAVAAPLATVLLSDGSHQAMPYSTLYTPTNGDTVLIDWPAGGVILGKVSTPPVGSYTPTSSGPITTTSQFKAIDSGNYYVPGGNWTAGDDPWCSTNNYGCWFYGTSPADTIPDSATILGVSVYVDPFYDEFPTSLATIGLHALLGKSGNPSPSSPVTISAGSGNKGLPTSFGDVLKTGAMRGLGTRQGGYHKFQGIAEDASSGLLTIAWSN